MPNEAASSWPRFRIAKPLQQNHCRTVAGSCTTHNEVIEATGGDALRVSEISCGKGAAYSDFRLVGGRYLQTDVSKTGQWLAWQQSHSIAEAEVNVVLWALATIEGKAVWRWAA